MLEGGSKESSMKAKAGSREAIREGEALEGRAKVPEASKGRQQLTGCSQSWS